MNLSRRRRHRRWRPLRRWRLWVVLALTALLCFLCRLLLLAAPDEDAATATHVVRAGDTIPRLCWRYKVRAEAIRAANPGVDDPLPPGRKLTIPLGHFDPAAAPTPATSAPRQAARPSPSAAPRRGQSAPPVVATTRLPPQQPEPAARPTPPPLGTVVSAGGPRP